MLISFSPRTLLVLWSSQSLSVYSRFPFSCAFYLTYIYCKLSVCPFSSFPLTLFSLPVFLFLLFHFVSSLIWAPRSIHTLFFVPCSESPFLSTFVSHTHFLDRRTRNLTTTGLFPSFLSIHSSTSATRTSPHSLCLHHRLSFPPTSCMLMHTHISLVSLRLLLLLMLLLRRC